MSTSSDLLVEDLFTLWRWIRRVSHPVKQGAVTPQQYWLLRHLRRHGPLTIGQVAEVLGVSQSSATTACKRLEASGLITRRRQTDDQRVVLVELTDKGETQVETWRRLRREALAHALEHLEPGEREELQRLVERILTITEIRDDAPDH
jgi:DNA-binding MarR family transcriptional regulator